MSQRRFVWLRLWETSRRKAFTPCLHTHVSNSERTAQGEPSLRLLDLSRPATQSLRLISPSCMAAAGSAQDYLRLLHFELDPASWGKRVAP